MLSDEVKKIIEVIESWYPDKMITEDMEDFDRGKLAGKVELIREIKVYVKKKSDDM